MQAPSKVFLPNGSTHVCGKNPVCECKHHTDGKCWTFSWARGLPNTGHLGPWFHVLHFVLFLCYSQMCGCTHLQAVTLARLFLGSGPSGAWGLWLGGERWWGEGGGVLHFMEHICNGTVWCWPPITWCGTNRCCSGLHPQESASRSNTQPYSVLDLHSGRWKQAVLMRATGTWYTFMTTYLWAHELVGKMLMWRPAYNTRTHTHWHTLLCL